MNFLRFAICNGGKSSLTCQKIRMISTRPESSLRQRMAEMEAKILASIDGVKNEVNDVKTEQTAMKKGLANIELDMGNLEKKILAVCSVADGVKHEVNQLAEMKKHLDAIKQVLQKSGRAPAVTVAAVGAGWISLGLAPFKKMTALIASLPKSFKRFLISQLIVFSMFLVAVVLPIIYKDGLTNRNYWPALQKEFHYSLPLYIGCSIFVFGILGLSGF